MKKFEKGLCEWKKGVRDIVAEMKLIPGQVLPSGGQQGVAHKKERLIIH